MSGLDSIVIRPYRPGEASYIAYLQMKFYEQEYGFKGTFEHYLLAAMSEFTASPDGSQIWVATDRDEIIGSIAIVRIDEHTAQLRWFFTEERYRGIGIGNRLMGTSVQFCRDRGYAHIFLWTFRGLDAAGHLYEKHGFRRTETKANTEWANEPLIEERWDLSSTWE